MLSRDLIANMTLYMNRYVNRFACFTAALLFVSSVSCSSDSGPSTDASVDGTAAGGTTGQTTRSPIPDAATIDAGITDAMTTPVSDGDAAPTPPLGGPDAGEMTMEEILQTMPPAARSICTEACARISECDKDRDEQICLESCANANAALAPKLRGDVRVKIVECLAQADCKTVLEPTLFSDCARGAAAAVAASAKTGSYCDAFSGKADACLDLLNKTSCLERAKVYNDEFIQRADACLSKSCNDYDVCVGVTLPAAIGPAGLWNGLEKVKKCQGNVYPCSSYSSSFQAQACEEQIGCSGAVQCAGTANCNSRYYQASCTSDPGCTWTPAPTYGCAGTAQKACAEYTSAATCDDARSCRWNLNCMGTAKPCDELSPSQCLTQRGCNLQ